MTSHDTTFMLGEKLKKIRTEQKLSLEDLAGKTDLTRSFLSQVENNKTSPSINSLVSIASALGVNVGDLFREEEAAENEVLHKQDRVTFSIERNQLVVELLTRRRKNRKFDPMLMRFGVGGDSGVITSSGAFFMAILEGKLELSVGDRVHILTEGDSIYLDASPQTRRSRNIGDIDVVAFAVASSPIL